MSNPSPLSSVQQALRYLIAESKAVLLAEADMRDVLGNTNVNIFKRRVEEAEAVLASLPQPEEPRSELGPFPISDPTRTWDEAIAAEARSDRVAFLPSGWQPIATAPKDGMWVIGYIDGYIRKVRLQRFDPPQHGESEWWCDEDGEKMLDPTLWMPVPPLPPAPAGEGQEELIAKWRRPLFEDEDGNYRGSCSCSTCRDARAAYRQRLKCADELEASSDPRAAKLLALSAEGGAGAVMDRKT